VSCRSRRPHTPLLFPYTTLFRSGAHAVVDLPLDFAPAEVRLDPDLRLWRLPDASQLPPILRQWIVARAPRLVIADALPALGRARSEEHTSELQSREKLVCRLLHE